MLGFLALSCAALAGGCRRAFAGKDDSTLVIIVHAQNPITKLTLDELRQFYRGERNHFDGGEPVIATMRPTGSPEKDLFLKNALGMSDREFKQEWLTRIYNGEVTSPPLVLDSEQAMRRYIARVRGAIGYQLKSSPLEGVKVVLTIS